VDYGEENGKVKLICVFAANGDHIILAWMIFRTISLHCLICLLEVGVQAVVRILEGIGFTVLYYLLLRHNPVNHVIIARKGKNIGPVAVEAISFLVT